MGVKVEAQNVSEERLNEFQTLAESLLSEGYGVHALSTYIANKYFCGVSLTFCGEDTILSLHQSRAI